MRKMEFFAMRKVPISPTGWKRNVLCREKGANFPDRMEKKLSCHEKMPISPAGRCHEKGAKFPDRMEKIKKKLS